MSVRVMALNILYIISVFLVSPVLALEVPTGKLPLGVTPTHYQLEMVVAPEDDRFSGEVQIQVKLDNVTQTIWLHGRGLDVANAYVRTSDGAQIPAIYTEIDNTGIVKLEPEIALEPGTVSLVIHYSAPFNQSLEGLYQVKKNGQAYAYTHFEALSARRAFPGFDEPRFKTPFDITVTIAGANTAISNAPERENVVLDDGRRRIVFQTTKPLPTYLVALAVGNFDVVEWMPIPANDIRPRPIPLRGIAPKGKGGKLSYALEHTAAMLTILEDYFASPYPYAKLDLIAVAEFNPGGMENAGAIFYRHDRILLDETPSNYQLRDFATLHAHELSHNWFGNLVTPAWWDDLWLNEAFATWMADRVVHIWQPKNFNGRGPVRRAKRAMWSDRLVSARQIRQPILSENDIANAFDSITYSKGGAVLSMVEQYMGSEKFRTGVQRFMARHRHGVATAEDFFLALSESTSNPGVITAFRSFIDQPGTPLVEVDWSCKSTGEAEVMLKQSRSLPLGSKGEADKNWSIPICLVYPEGDGLQSQCLLMDTPHTSVQLPTTSCPAWVLPNKAGAAYLHFALPDHRWDTLIDHMDQLQSSEAMSVMASVGAAYEAGTISTSRLLMAARFAAQSLDWDLAGTPMQNLRDIKNFILPKDLRATAFAELQDIYRPALARFDLSDAGLAKDEASSDLALLRGDLIWFMAYDAREPDLRKRLSRLGQAYIGYLTDNALDRDVLHPDLVRIALIVATEEIGIGFAEVLINRLKRTEDSVLRAHIIRVLAFQFDREIVERIWSLILDPDFSKRDAGQLLRYQGRLVVNREVLFEWMITNFDALVERLPRSQRAWLPWRSSAFCDENSRNRVEAFYRERVKGYRGAPRSLANVLEAIDICSAIVGAQRANAVKMFSIQD